MSPRCWAELPAGTAARKAMLNEHKARVEAATALQAAWRARGGRLEAAARSEALAKGPSKAREAHESKVQALDVPPGRRRAKCSTDLLPETAAKGRQLAVEANPVALGDVAAAGGADVVGKGAVAGSPRAPRCLGCVIC